MHAFRFRDFRVGIGEDVQLATPGLHFLEVGLQLVEQLVVRGNRDDRHLGVDQRQRAVLQFAGRVGFGVDVGYFLQLQGTFEGNRIVPAAAQEQGVLFVGKALGPGFDFRLKLQHLVRQPRGGGATGR